MLKKIFLICFFSQSLIFAQINISRISIDFNYIKNYQFIENYRYSFSPEFKLGGKLFSDKYEWEIFILYWNDGINKPLNGVVDYTTFNYSDYTFGSNIYFFPFKKGFQLLFNGGLAYKHIIQKYISGSQTGNPIDNRFYNILSLDLGCGIGQELNSTIRIRAEFNVFISLLGDTTNIDEFNNSSVKFGFDYSLQ